MDICLQRIIGLLSERNISNTEFTAYLGCPSSAVSEWKKGKVSSYQKYIVQIANYFDVSADYLLGRTDMRKGGDWDDLIKQYQLCSDDKKILVNRLLGLSQRQGGIPKSVSTNDEEDMTMVVELLSMFDNLNLIGKSRVIATAADEIDKNKNDQ